MYSATLDRFRDYLGHEPTVDDLEDLTAAKFLRWRQATQHSKWKKISPASLAKDSAQPTCKPWLIETRKTAHAAPHAKSAGKGHGGAALNRFKPEGGASDMVRKDRLTMNA
jgi:hypothetical protein